MDFIKDIVQTKMVFLGFSYDKVMASIQVLIKNKKIKTKKDVVTYLETMILENQQKANVKQLFQKYQFIYDEAHSKSHVFKFSFYQRRFRELVVHDYLIFSSIDSNVLMDQYRKVLTGLGYLEAKYPLVKKFIRVVIPFLSRGDQLQLSQPFHFSKMISVEEKVLYALRFLCLQKFSNVSVSIKDALSSSQLDTIYLNYFKKALATFHVDLQTYLLRSEKLDVWEREQLAFFTGGALQPTLSFSNLQEQLSFFLSNQCSVPLYSIPLKVTKKAHDLFDWFPGVKAYDLLEAVDFLKQYFPHLYQIVIKRNGDSLTDYNSLTKEESRNYHAALYKIRAYLKDRNRAVELADGITLFSFFPDVKRDHVLYGLKLLRKENESYYQIIQKKYGVSFTKKYSFSTKEEQETYRASIYRLTVLVYRYECYFMAKDCVREQTTDLSVIQEKRAGLSNASIMKNHSLSLGEVFDIYARNLVLFSKKGFLDVIEEFFVNHQEEKLLNNLQYQNLVLTTPQYSVLTYKKKLLEQIEKQREIDFDVNSYVPKRKTF